MARGLNAFRSQASYAGAMDEQQLHKRTMELDSLLTNCIPADPDDPSEYQITDIYELAGILAGYEQRIAALEAKFAERTEADG